MKRFSILFYLLPLFIILIEIIFFNFNYQSIQINPSSAKNTTLNQIIMLLNTAKLKPVDVVVRDYQNEIEFYLTKSSNGTFQVIMSTKTNPIIQVTALQKVLKIANIKGQDIKFIDLSSSKPYATL